MTTIPPATTDGAHALPTASVVTGGGDVSPRSRVLRLGEAVLWLALAAPGIYQVVLLVIAVAGRLHYPYDLEWMEGGMLHHALRIANGDGIYVPPSVDFIPYLYTPLYPSLIALFGNAFGITYTVGRAISAVSLAAIGLVAFLSLASAQPRDASRGPALAGAALSLGLFAAIYPYVEGWYDLVRADTLFLFMITAAIAGLARWARSGSGLEGHAKVAAGAAILALAFFCKQTGVIYVAFGGVVVLVLAWRRAFTYAVVAGAIGLGGTWVLNRASHGWFWIYTSKIHRAHDFNMDRFWASFGKQLWHFRAMTIVVAIGLVVTFVTWALTPANGSPRRFPAPARPLVLWSAAYAVSTVVGCVGWGTEFAFFNAYMPAFLHGALAAGAALPAVAGCARIACANRNVSARVGAAVGTLGAVGLAIALGVTCWFARWDPQRFIPTAADVAAGDKLIARLRALDGDIWVPSHPWYAELAGKTPHVHRMGVKDVTVRQPRTIAGLDDAIRSHQFSAIVFDDHDLSTEYQAELQTTRAELHREYRPALKLPADERPRVYTGAPVTPDSIWVPAIPAVPPADARVLFAFEDQAWTGWSRDGLAWGNGPIDDPPSGTPIVYGATGHRFASSAHGGDVVTGRMTSPAFVIDGTRITMQLGGGTDATKLRVELWIDGAIARTASVPLPGGDSLHEVAWDVSDVRGKTATLVLVDDATTPGGHLEVDDVWLWRTPT